MNVSRRSLIRLGVGTAALGALAPALGAATGAKRKFIYVIAAGGWDVTYAFAPKVGIPTIQGPEFHENPDVPEDRNEVRTFDGLPIMTNDLLRPSVTTFFEKAAKDAVVVNGVWVGTIGHDQARYRLLCGTTHAAKPDVSVIAGSVHGTALPLGSIDTSGLSQMGPLAASGGRIGFRNQIRILVDGTAALPPAGDWASQIDFTPSDAQIDELSRTLRARAERLRVGRDLDLESAARFDSWQQAFDRADRIRNDGAAILNQLELASVPTLTSQFDLAVDLLKGGLCHSVAVGTNQPWDTHTDSAPQNIAYEATFEALGALYDRLLAEGMLDETLVMVISEFTRTPLYNADGGKDHWPHATALLFGGGLEGGRACGGHSENLESLPMDLETGESLPEGSPCRYDNLAAGILEMLDVDPEEWLPGVAPFRGAEPA
jgi:hypothetical protein